MGRIFRKLKELFYNDIEFVISFDTAQTISKALTTLSPGDRLIIEAPDTRVVIVCREMKIEVEKQQHDETHLDAN